MRKMVLDINSLTVESFTTARNGVGVGTVRGYATAYQSCMVYPAGDSNYDVTCEPGLSNDEYSCHYGVGGCSNPGGCDAGTFYVSCQMAGCPSQPVIEC